MCNKRLYNIARSFYLLYTQIIYLLFLHPQITYLDCILSISFPIKIVITASNLFFMCILFIEQVNYLNL
jgi:hypothetical protein